MPTRVRLKTHADGSYVLDDAQQETLAELIEEANGLSDLITAQLVRFGRTAFRKVFRSDTALLVSETKSPNPVWRELCRRAGGPTLRMVEATLSTAVRIAAWVKSVNDRAFTDLDPDWKVLLFPLNDADRMREAAQHVSKYKLSFRKTREYLQSLREKGGAKVAVRLTAPRVDQRLDGLAELGAGEGRKAVVRLAKNLRPEQKTALARKAKAALKGLEHLLAELDEDGEG